MFYYLTTTDQISTVRFCQFVITNILWLHPLTLELLDDFSHLIHSVGLVDDEGDEDVRCVGSSVSIDEFGHLPREYDVMQSHEATFKMSAWRVIRSRLLFEMACLVSPVFRL